jgi:hypothetical protein
MYRTSQSELENVYTTLIEYGRTIQLNWNLNYQDADPDVERKTIKALLKSFLEIANSSEGVQAVAEKIFSRDTALKEKTKTQILEKYKEFLELDLQGSYRQKLSPTINAENSSLDEESKKTLGQIKEILNCIGGLKLLSDIGEGVNIKAEDTKAGEELRLKYKKLQRDYLAGENLNLLNELGQQFYKQVEENIKAPQCTTILAKFAKEKAKNSKVFQVESIYIILIGFLALLTILLVYGYNAWLGNDNDSLSDIAKRLARDAVVPLGIGSIVLGSQYAWKNYKITREEKQAIEKAGKEPSKIPTLVEKEYVNNFCFWKEKPLPEKSNPTSEAQVPVTKLKEKTAPTGTLVFRGT